MPGFQAHQGLAAFAADLDPPLQDGIAQHVVAADTGIDAVAAPRIARITQRPGPLLLAQLRAVLVLVQVVQAVEAIDLDTSGIADPE